MGEISKVWWNEEYQTYEAIHADGQIEPLRDSHEAQELADKYGLSVEG